MSGNLNQHHQHRKVAAKENQGKPMAKKKRQSPNGEQFQHQQTFQLRPKKINPLTDAQKDMFDAYREGYNLFLTGCAGTGKTFCAIYLALKDATNQALSYTKVYIVRSAVPSRDMGFLPGKLKEKLEAFDAPYRTILSGICGRGDAWEIATQRGHVEVISTSYLRGVTLSDCIIVVDECQNMNYKELATIITRCGENSRIIFCGDTVQDDLYRSKYDTSGMDEFQDVIERMPSMEIVEFEPEDIVRGGICKEFILAELKLPIPESTTTAT